VLYIHCYPILESQLDTVVAGEPMVTGGVSLNYKIGHNTHETDYHGPFPKSVWYRRSSIVGSRELGYHHQMGLFFHLLRRQFTGAKEYWVGYSLQ